MNIKSNGKLITALLIPAMLLTGCVSQADKDKAEELNAFNDWATRVASIETYTYAESEVNKTASDLVPLINYIHESLPESRFRLDLSVLAKSTWKSDVCKAGDKNDKGFLTAPIIGSVDIARPTLNGYINKTQISDISKVWKNSKINENDGWNGFYGTDILYPYYAKQYITQTASENFDVILLADSGWNALLWSEYKNKETPDKIDYTANLQPTDAYMPFEVLVFYKGNCN